MREAPQRRHPQPGWPRHPPGEGKNGFPWEPTPSREQLKEGLPSPSRPAANQRPQGKEQQKLQARPSEPPPPDSGRLRSAEGAGHVILEHVLKEHAADENAAA